MAMYKYGQFLEKSDDAAFDKLYKPGETVPHSGIYQCNGCHDEVACNAGDPFPPQNHHQHNNNTLIRWKLLVYSVQL